MWFNILLLCENERKRNTSFAYICIEPLSGYKKPTTLGIRVAGGWAGREKFRRGRKGFHCKEFHTF